MALDPATVRRIATLARIRMDDAEVATLAGELNTILGWIEQLNEVDISGVDPLTGGVAAALDENGRIVDSGQRIWAQTEYLRALATHGDEAARERLPRQIELFAARFLTPRGWIECRSAEGAITRAEMPSTTPYHLATAYAGLPSD